MDMQSLEELSLSRFLVPTELPVFEANLSGLPNVLKSAREALEELRASHPASTPSMSARSI